MDALVYQLKIVLNGIKPPVWRRDLATGNTTISRLHEIIQVAMGGTTGTSTDSFRQVTFMRTAACIILLCLTTAAADTSELLIRIPEMKAHANGVITAEFLNDSNHDIQLPTVTTFCRAAPGMLHAELVDQPHKKDRVGYGMGCFICSGKASPVLEQAKRWTILKPGQSTDVVVHLNMMLPFQEEGVYQFRLSYTRPAFTPDEWRELKEAHIDVPVTDAESEPVSIELFSNHLTLLQGAP